jgi:ankyrin repeat protein
MNAEAQVYRNWYDAFNGRNLPQAIKLGEAYLQQYPTGKYAAYITKIIEFARTSLNEEKISQAKAFRRSIQAPTTRDATQLEFLLEQALNGRADVNATTTDGRTPLMFAAAERRAEAMKALLEKGANPDVIENTQGLTALIYAIWGGDRNLVRSLLQYYPNATIKDKEGRTALDHAMLSADFEMMLLMIG